MKNLASLTTATIVVLALSVSLFFTGCKEEQNEDKATVSLKIYDPRDPHSETKTTTEGIVNSEDLTKCEVTFSSIQLKNSEGNYVELLTASKTVDLRDLQGIVGDLVSTEIPLGDYTQIKVTVSGVSTTYEGNNYTASVSAPATATLAQTPGVTYTQAQGVTNVFAGGAVVFEYNLAFTLADITDFQNVHLQFDTDASVYVISFTYLTYTWNFAGIRPALNLGIILEEGIQQIRHSPPYGITIASQNEVNYYGIHTFVDFDQNGGTINSHTSQHVFRGADGTLLIDAEPMATNPNVLVPNTVNATGETDIRSDETFRYTEIVSNLQTAGYTLTSGQTYYFSLRKTWNITTNGTTYNLTRICEPIPVVIP